MSWAYGNDLHIDGLVQERRHFIANFLAMSEHAIFVVSR